jgi:hypothetical protein
MPESSSSGGGPSSVEQPAGLFGSEDAQAGDMLWDAPDLPDGIALEIDGIAVLPDIVEAYLLPPWADYAIGLPLGTPVEEITTGYFADPETVFYDLVRGVVLLRAAEERFAELDPHELADFKARMESAAGTAKDSLVRRYGVDGWNAHIERQFRLQLMIADFRQYAAEISEEELFAFYDSEVLAQLPPPDQRAQVDISFEAMEDMLRANLMKDRAIDAQEAWLDEEIVGVEVKATLPAGLSHDWTVTGPR